MCVCLCQEIERLKNEKPTWERQTRWAGLRSVFGGQPSLMWISPFAGLKLPTLVRKRTWRGGAEFSVWPPVCQTLHSGGIQTKQQWCWWTCSDSSWLHRSQQDVSEPEKPGDWSPSSSYLPRRWGAPTPLGVSTDVSRSDGLEADAAARVKNLFIALTTRSDSESGRFLNVLVKMLDLLRAVTDYRICYRTDNHMNHCCN